jgi:Tfp pilus assembly PilM family ATPase/Tfp pilus assembly protein PilN
MAKRCIGIDIGRSYVRAVQMTRTPEGLVIEKTFGTQTRRNTDSLPGILRSLTTEHGFDRRADVAVSLPCHAVSFAEVQTDAAGLQALRAGETPRLRDVLPIPADDAVIRVCSARLLPKGQYSVLVAAAPAETIREQLQLFKNADLRPTIVEAPVVAMHAAVALNYPELGQATTLIVGLDESTLTLAVIKEMNIRIVRNIPVPRDEDRLPTADSITDIIEREIDITRRKVFGASENKDMCVFLMSAPATGEQLLTAIQERTECRIIATNPYVNVRRSADDTDFPVYVAEGLAARALAGEEADHGDFLSAYDVRRRPGWSIRRELLACAALVVVTAAVWFTGLFVRLSTLESQYARLKQQMELVFHQALPQEQNIVNPMAQIQQRLDAFRQENGAFSSFRPGRYSPLEIMQLLTAHTPRTGGLRCHDLLITADSVQAVGSCDSFAVLSEWQRLLKQMPGFSAVEIQDQKKDARTGQVQFTLSMSSAGVKP